MDGLFEARELHEHAQAFERAGDYTAALARLREAERLAACAPDLQAEIALTRARVESELRAWRAAIERRQAAFLARELAEADAAPDREQETERRRLLDRLLGRRPRGTGLKYVGPNAHRKLGSFAQMDAKLPYVR
jgi:hypothetical protein